MTQLCFRCKKPTTITTMSLFNTDMCCVDCIETERAHPEFPRARAEELNQSVNANTFEDAFVKIVEENYKIIKKERNYF